MKKTLFGGMKVKGPTAKNDDVKKDNNTPQPQASQTNLNSTQAKVQTPQQSLKPQPHIAQHKDSTMSSPNGDIALTQQPQLKPAKTSIQSVLKQEYPKLHKKQSNRQELQSKPLGGKPKPSSSKQMNNFVQEESVGSRKDWTKSRSEKNYDGENSNSENNDDVREDRSVVVEGSYRPEEDREEVQFKKPAYNKSKPGSTTGPKSNPLLNQIKKIATTSKQAPKQDLQQKSQKDSALQQSTKRRQSLSASSKPKRQQSTIMQQLYSSHSRILESLTRKKQSKQQIITLTTHIIEMKDELSVLINKQNHYIASQEYELADKLENKISDITTKVNEEEVEISSVQEELFRMELEGLAILRQHLEEEKRTIRRLKLVELDIEDDITHFKRQEEEKIDGVRMGNENQKKKYQRIVMDIKNQSEQLEKYEKTFYQDLNSRKQPLQNLLIDEQQKRTELQAQIKELQEKLKKKKTLLKTTLTSIESTKQKLYEVDMTFEQEKQKLDQRKRHVTHLEAEKSQQNKKLSEMEEEVRKLEKQKLEEISKMTREKEQYHKLSNRLERFFDNVDVEGYLNRKKQVIEEFMACSKHLKAFQQKHKQQKDLINELQFQKSNILSQITKNQQRIKQLKASIPKLQTQQKQLSLAKNFKGAGMKKNEIKECTDEIAVVKKMIEDAYATEAEIDSKIEGISEEQGLFVEEENGLRRELALSQYRLALEKKKEIGKELEWLKQLEKGSKVKAMYEGQLSEQLAQIEQEISYIAQEYELQPQVEQQVPTKYEKQPPTLSSSLKLSTSLQSSKKPAPSLIPTTTQPQQPVYIPLTLNDNEQEIEQLQQQQQQQADIKKESSSNQHLESQQEEENNNNDEVDYEKDGTGEGEGEQVKGHGDVYGHHQQEVINTHDDGVLDNQQHLAYVPLQLGENQENEQDEIAADEENNNQLEDEEQEDQQKAQGQEDQEAIHTQHQTHHGTHHDTQEDEDGGYVPLQLD